MCRWSAILFDLDDTLYLERDYVMSGFWAVAIWAEAHLGVSHTRAYAELRQLFAYGVRGSTFNQWLALQGHSEALVPTLVSVYRNHSPNVFPFPGMQPLLVALRRQGAIGLVSDGYLEVQRRKLEALGLAPCFDAVVFSDSYGRDHWKPSTRAFLAVAEELNLEPHRAVYVADNPLKDFLGARRAGMRTVRLTHADGEYVRCVPPTAEHAPDLTVDTVAKLGAVLIGDLGRGESRSSCGRMVSD